MARLTSRLAQLEERYPPAGCPVCAQRPAILIAAEDTPPRPCPRCGAVPVRFTIVIDRMDGTTGN